MLIKKSQAKYAEYRTAGHLVLKTLTGSWAEKSSKCHKSLVSFSEPSVNQTLDWLFFIDIW